MPLNPREARYGRYGGVAAALALALLPLAVQADQLLDEADRLLAGGDAESAYSRLQAVEMERAGEVRFDYLLGIAAADAGHPNQALFAFDRVLAVEPDHQQARAERGRAHYLLGEYAAARSDFNAVLAQQPPAKVRATIHAYLQRIDAQMQAQQGSWSGSLGVTLGSDSNVNSATDATTVAVPVVGLTMQISPTSQASDDSFGQLDGSAAYSRQLSTTARLMLSAGLKARRHGDLDAYDNETLDLAAAVEQQLGDDSLTFAAFRQKFRVDAAVNRQLQGVGVDWRTRSDPLTSYGLFGQLMQLRYPDQAMRDANQSNLGLSARHNYATLGVVLDSALFVGRERNLAGRPDLGRDLYGLRMAAAFAPSETLPMKARLTLQSSRQHADDPFFLERREDLMIDLALDAEYRFAESWSVTPSLRHTRNDATIDLYDYTRNQASVGLSYRF